MDDPTALVDPIDGTGSGTAAGAIGEFPGADVPFGMLQWSPVTTPDAAGAGSGYSYADRSLTGFGLTTLSGTGCTGFNDVPILPTVGGIGQDPEAAQATFTHDGEHASPGRYSVSLDAPATIDTRLAVTTRTGLSSFSFPRTGQANVLFKVAAGANTIESSTVHLLGRDEVVGSVTADQFCGTGTSYTLYFAVRFDRSFAAGGSWNGSSVWPGRTSCSGAACGAWVTFDTTTDPAVLMKVGISYVSTAGARANLAAEDPGWSLSHVEDRARQRWNDLLRQIRVGGGTPTQQRIFYTALYHSLLFPSVVSDHSGDYRGDDGKVHHAENRLVYSNFSEWDTYRSQIQLVSMIAPHQAGDMVQSLVDDAEQGGWLPKWAMPDGDASQMNGDSADPIIASAYAFGVRNFDVGAALRAMVKGATRTETAHGLEIERQYLDQYLHQHYVDAGSLDLGSITYSDGASATLEYAIDDFSIATLAGARGDHALEKSMLERAHNWEYLFDPPTGYLGARATGGAFPTGPAFQTSQFEPGGQTGFEEGNAVQYTWSVPQDLAGLAALMGGPAAARSQLDAFFAQLASSRYEPNDWPGNEPDLWAPWEYDAFGAPWRTQAEVRTVASAGYADAPVDEPGNDDLGALSSWYVWAALGLYPLTPGSANLSLSTPFFPTAVVRLADGKSITVHAPGAGSANPYVHRLRVAGVASPRTAATCAPAGSGGHSGAPATTASDWNLPWLPSVVLRTGGALTYTLGSTPDRGWGAAPGDGPPSVATGRLPAVGFSVPNGAVSVTAGQTVTVQLGIDRAGADAPPVTWQVAGGTPLDASPSSGTFAAAASCTEGLQPTQTLSITGSVPGTYDLAVHLTASGGAVLPPVVLSVTVDG